MSLVLVVGLLGCNVESKDSSTGGIDLPVTRDSRGALKCPSGMVAVLGDFVSSQVALLDPQGEALSASFLSSGSTQASGLAAPFSGDLVVPGTRPLGDEVTLIDRYATNVLTWADPKTASVRAQLPVGTGFESNPYDYLELSKTKAYVARFGDNAAPGKEPFDQGGDILVIDPSVPKIVSSIALPRGTSFPPAPVSLTLRNETVIVVLQRFDSMTFMSGESELLGFNTMTDEVSWNFVLQGKKACGRAELSPSEKLLAVSCTGIINLDGTLADPNESGVLVFDATTTPPTLKKTISVHAQLGFSSQGELAFASETQILSKTQTPYGGVGDNQLFVLDLTTEITRVLATARPDKDGKGKGVVYNGLKCMPGCNDLCLLADTDTGTIRRFDAKADFMELAPVTIESSSGLPPVGLGPF
ncbi:MAG: hypothetical protein SFV15_20275 [Polyangiaceae bacterium]|nr:hypothetical protein [Polyangiaceae bacterium]